MNMKFGYLQLGLEPDIEDELVQIMQQEGCVEIFKERKCDVYRLLAWEKMTAKIGQEDILVYPSISHVAMDPVKYRELKDLCKNQHIRRFSIDDVANGGRLTEDTDFKAADEGIRIAEAIQARHDIALTGMYEVTTEEFPDLDNYCQRKIAGARILSFGVTEEKLGQVIPEFASKVKVYKLKKRWMKERTYRLYLNKEECKLFESEDFTHRKVKSKIG